MKKILITGASGLIGGAVLYEALQLDTNCVWVALIRGADVESARSKLADRLKRFCSLSLANTLLKKVNIILGDLAEISVHEDFLADVTHILHLAADTSFSRPASNWAVNFDGTMALADAAEKMPNLQRFIHVSTATICGADPEHIVHETDFPRSGIDHLVEYTRTKAATEFMLRERYRNLPIIIARPSIVAGHTKLGVRPSSSIFWFVRFAERIGLVPGSPDCHIDIIPSDWTAKSLLGLMLKPELSHETYHLSAGLAGRSTWRGLALSMAKQRGETAPELDTFSPDNMEVVWERVSARLGYSGPTGKLIVRAAQRYYRFCGLDLTFDNSRLLSEGFDVPPKLEDYLGVCISKSPHLSILDAFMDDTESLGD